MDTIQASLVRQGVTVFLSEEKVRVVVCAVLCAICQVRRLGNLAILSALALLTYLYVLRQEAGKLQLHSFAIFGGSYFQKDRRTALLKSTL